MITLTYKEYLLWNWSIKLMKYHIAVSDKYNLISRCKMNRQKIAHWGVKFKQPQYMYEVAVVNVINSCFTIGVRKG